MALCIITDNEWEGKYENVESLWLVHQNKVMDSELESKINKIISLGDNLPTGTKENVGSESYFKIKLKELTKPKPELKNLNLKDQLKIVFDYDPEKFIKNYGSSQEILLKSTNFLKNSQIPIITAIMGNREFDYQILFDFLAEKIGCAKVDYLGQLNNCNKFELHKKPSVIKYENTSLVLLPYNPKPEKMLDSLDKNLEEISRQKSEMILLMTHENPAPELFGIERPAKMKYTIDNYINEIKKMSKNIVCFCGHIDKSSEPLDYKGIKLFPVSGSEAIIFDPTSYNYKREVF